MKSPPYSRPLGVNTAVDVGGVGVSVVSGVVDVAIPSFSIAPPHACICHHEARDDDKTRMHWSIPPDPALSTAMALA
jgi:hypothetical protein